MWFCSAMTSTVEAAPLARNSALEATRAFTVGVCVALLSALAKAINTAAPALEACAVVSPMKELRTCTLPLPPTMLVQPPTSASTSACCVASALVKAPEPNSEKPANLGCATTVELIKASAFSPPPPVIVTTVRLPDEPGVPIAGPMRTKDEPVSLASAVILPAVSASASPTLSMLALVECVAVASMSIALAVT